MGLNFDVEVTGGLEALYQTKDAARRREAVLDALQLPFGQRILDIGSSPGFLASQMAEAVGRNGEIVGIDLSQPMLNMASTRCADKPWVTFQPGAATELPFDHSSFDAAISIQVLEYIADVGRALSEMHRVIRPGGRGVIVSTDWDAIAWQTLDSARMSERNEYFFSLHQYLFVVARP